MAKTGAPYSGHINAVLKASSGALPGPLSELVKAISHNDKDGPPQWTTEQGRHTARKVLENHDLPSKLLKVLKVLKGNALADAITVLTWLATASLHVVQSLVEIKAIDLLCTSFTMPSKDEKSKNLSRLHCSILDMLLLIICHRSRLDSLQVPTVLQINMAKSIVSSGLAHKIIDLHREIYTRSKAGVDRIRPMKVLCKLAKRHQVAEFLCEEGIMIHIVNRLNTCPDDAYAAEFISNIVRAEITHRPLRTHDFLSIAKKVTQTLSATESSKLRMVLSAAHVYGRRSEVQTFLQTHALPADVASTLYNIIGDSDGDFDFTMNSLNELLSGRSGYAASATPRAAAKLISEFQGILRTAKLERNVGPSSEVFDWLGTTLAAKTITFMRTGELSGVPAVLYLMRYSLVMESSLTEKVLSSTINIHNIAVCIPDLTDCLPEQKEMLSACGNAAMFILSYSLNNAPPDTAADAVEVLSSGSAGLVSRLYQHLVIADQPHDSLAACMHVVSALASVHMLKNESKETYTLLKKLFDLPVAKLLGANVGIKHASLARQALVLLNVLLQHTVQVTRDFPDSVASKRLHEWTEMLFEMQAVPKVLVMLGMSSDELLLEAGTRIISNLVHLGYGERLVAAISVIVAQCSLHPDDPTKSQPILQMATKRELRMALRECDLLRSMQSWLEERKGDSKIDLLASLAFLYSGELEMEGVGDYLMSQNIIEQATHIAISACTSADDYVMVAGLRWSAVDALNILRCLSSNYEMALLLLENGCATTTAAALSKYLHRPSRSKSLHDSFLKVSNKPKEKKSVKKASNEIQAESNSPQADSDPQRSETDQATRTEAEAAARDAAVIEQAKELLPMEGNSGDRISSEPLLACQIILNLCSFPEAINILMETEAVQDALRAATDSSDKCLRDMAVSCLVHLEALDLEHLAVKSSLSSARTVCWNPSKEPQFDVFISHVHTEAEEDAWWLFNMLNILGLRVFMNIEPDEDNRATVLDLIEKSANFILIISETTLENPLCIEDVKTAAACNKTVTGILAPGVRWRDRSSKNVLTSNPFRHYTQITDLQEALDPAMLTMGGSQQQYQSLRENLQEHVKPFNQWATNWEAMDIFNFEDTDDDEIDLEEESSSEHQDEEKGRHSVDDVQPPMEGENQEFSDVDSEHGQAGAPHDLVAERTTVLSEKKRTVGQSRSSGKNVSNVKKLLNGPPSDSAPTSPASKNIDVRQPRAAKSASRSPTRRRGLTPLVVDSDDMASQYDHSRRASSEQSSPDKPLLAQRRSSRLIGRGPRRSQTSVLHRSETTIDGRDHHRILEMEARLEKVLDGAESEIKFMVDREVARRIDGLMSEMQEQLELRAARIQAEMQTRISEMLERQDTTQLLVEKSLKVMEQRIEKMEERTAEATTAAAGALAAATSVHRQLEGMLPKLEMAASQIRKPSYSPGAGVQTSPGATSLHSSIGLSTPLLPPLLRTPDLSSSLTGDNRPSSIEDPAIFGASNGHTVFEAEPWTTDEHDAVNILYTQHASQRHALDLNAAEQSLKGHSYDPKGLPSQQQQQRLAPVNNYDVQFQANNRQQNAQVLPGSLQPPAAAKLLPMPIGLPAMGGSFLRGPAGGGTLKYNQQQNQLMHVQADSLGEGSGRTYLQISRKA